ncbi:hypothetical protein [Blastopirellula marina]|uniref:hypothetical protein n=1 Tax=Blastopirellula marina TaxID=124 RepID=UPI0002F7E671|nr:hypothetical protein [Blastopirellula marina]
MEATVRIVTVATGNQLEAIATAGLSNSKYFFPQPPQQNFATSGIVFDRIGVAIFDNGSCNCTGRLQYDGGHDKVFHGANVLVKVRAFAGPPGSPDTTLEGMRLVFQTQKRIWVRRDGEIMTSLIPTQVDSASTYAATSNYTVSANYTNYLPALVQQDFNRITHVEIVFHYMHEM